MDLIEGFLETIKRTSLPDQPTMFARDSKGEHHVIALVGNERQLARSMIKKLKIRAYTIARMEDGKLVFTSESRSEVGRLKATYSVPEYVLLKMEMVAGSLW